MQLEVGRVVLEVVVVRDGLVDLLAEQHSRLVRPAPFLVF